MTKMGSSLKLMAIGHREVVPKATHPKKANGVTPACWLPSRPWLSVLINHSLTEGVRVQAREPTQTDRDCEGQSQGLVGAC